MRLPWHVSSWNNFLWMLRLSTALPSVGKFKNEKWTWISFDWFRYQSPSLKRLRKSIATLIFVFTKTRLLTCPYHRRSLREDRPNAKWQAIKEKEDQYQKVHAESLLQRVVHLWSALRTNSGALSYSFSLNLNPRTSIMVIKIKMSAQFHLITRHERSKKDPISYRLILHHRADISMHHSWMNQAPECYR